MQKEPYYSTAETADVTRMDIKQLKDSLSRNERINAHPARNLRDLSELTIRNTSIKCLPFEMFKTKCTCTAAISRTWVHSYVQLYIYLFSYAG